MHEKNLRCPVCMKEFPLKPRLRCTCGGNLEIIFDYKKLRKVSFQNRAFNHSRYIEFYPVKNLLSLGEGGTPLVRSRNLEKLLGLKCRLYFKLESLNPTGSFKDRGSSVEISKARELGKKKVIVASTGNMGSSIAAYSASAGLDCTVIIPHHVKHVKIAQMLIHGAKVARLWGSYSEAASIVESSKEYVLGDYLYRREGTKSVGFEIAEQVNADWIFLPIGNGNLTSAVWKAFNEFKLVGRVKKLPKLMGVQATGCSPVTKAWKSGSLVPVKKTKTIASSIECGNPLDGFKALRALKESKGAAVTVSDREMIKAISLLARKEGIFAEPAGAAALAGLIKSEARGNVVCVVTGHGLKDPYEAVRGKPIKMRGLNTLRGIKN